MVGAHAQSYRQLVKRKSLRCPMVGAVINLRFLTRLGNDHRARFCHHARLQFVTKYGTTRGHSRITWNREFYSLGLVDQALMTLHESLHLFANFTDYAIADAAHILATRNETSAGELGNFRSQDEASIYINQQIAEHCRP
jgi:hypothetical protein